jgi:2,3-dihydroxy-2,3-dihydro-p-cumate dehydrogenase
VTAAQAPGARRSAIVTGVGMGIGGVGRAIAARLAADGLRGDDGRRRPRVAEVAAEIAEAAGQRRDPARPTPATSRSSATCRRWSIDDRAFGRVDVLVNNAGSGVIRPFLEHDEASLTQTLQRNLWTTLWCCHKALPHMVEANHGRIVNIGADSLRTGIPQHAGYNAAKGGVVGLMVGLAKEFAAYDITINTVSPCVVNTERHRTRLREDPALAEPSSRSCRKAAGSRSTRSATW